MANFAGYDGSGDALGTTTTATRTGMGRVGSATGSTSVHARTGFGLSGESFYPADDAFPERLGFGTKTSQSIGGMQAELGDGFGSTQTNQRAGLADDGQGSGIFIPSAWFRRVEGQVVDIEGNPITRAKYLHAIDKFNTSAEVDDNGEFTIRLLKRAYNQFMLTAESDRKGVDYAWYEPKDTYVGNDEDNVTLVFEINEITGNYAGDGVDMGGQLG